eukprot:7386588-Prymnesium_polylepis.6
MAFSVPTAFVLDPEHGPANQIAAAITSVPEVPHVAVFVDMVSNATQRRHLSETASTLNISTCSSSQRTLQGCAACEDDEVLQELTLHDDEGRNGTAWRGLKFSSSASRSSLPRLNHSHLQQQHLRCRLGPSSATVTAPFNATAPAFVVPAVASCPRFL